jgi:histidyl-tRNA synthetase
MVVVGSQAEAAALKMAEQLREDLPKLRLETLCGGGSFKSQLKRADKSGAQWAIILGDSETEKRVVGLKSLRIEAPQVEVAWDALAGVLSTKL